MDGTFVLDYCWQAGNYTGTPFVVVASFGDCVLDAFVAPSVDVVAV